MKNLTPTLPGSKTGKVIVSFGRARLVRLPGGAMELRGGQPADLTAAKEWISLFMHEAVPRLPDLGTASGATDCPA
jgi:hypothetical protein